MTPNLRTSWIVILFLVLFLFGTGLAMAEDNLPMMKMPVDGVCQEPYVLIKGVCALSAFVQGQPATIVDEVKAFKAENANKPQESVPAVSPENEEPLCVRYKQILEEHTKSKGIAFNSETEKTGKVRGQASETSIEEAREYILNFCQD